MSRVHDEPRRTVRSRPWAGAAAAVAVVLGLLAPVSAQAAGTDGEPPVATTDPPSSIGAPPLAQATPVLDRPRASGPARVGGRLHARTGEVTAGTTPAYRWYRRTASHRLVPIARATHRTYLLRAGDRGRRVSVVVTYRGSATTPTEVRSPARRVQ